MLDVTRPTLAYEGQATGPATLEKPVNVLVAPVASNGDVVGPEGLATFAYYVYRRPSAGSSLDVWDDATKLWTPETTTGVDRTPTLLAYQAGDPTPWRGIIVGAGGRDATGQPQFERAVGGYPTYSVRAYFVTADHSEALLTGPSDNLTFVGTAERNLMVIGPGDGEQLDSAVLHPDGRIEITPAAGRRVVVAGDLEADHVIYLPAGGAVKQTLT